MAIRREDSNDPWLKTLKESLHSLQQIFEAAQEYSHAELFFAVSVSHGGAEFAEGKASKSDKAIKPDR